MNTVIFKTAAPVLTALMLVFSIFVLLRGHNEPGGGFIGGLIGASGLAIYGIAAGVDACRRALRVHPIVLAGLGVVLAAIAGFISLAAEVPFLTGLWWIFEFEGTEIALSTPLIFDIGVYAVVVGAVGTIALSLEGEEGEEEDD
ncbi:Na+/H+ antiporter subunit B [Pelagibacterium nitratireducens]|jgi:multicomponent Na+:H+ antiporter subunit B|uniref:Na+/H+ antiporter subunit B n=1 Tax=Pelagibacterium nitratireducens TaxID=1046114 RepID=A0ABZ2HWJ4_9HYPH|nr:Na(+)/H(+) antiporter subunit B [Pelagibacterium sp.]|tara:strand:+ start:4917 stop:5348 length:432 start_codon:yes stop_codon:yes gene_type:complete